MTAEPIILDAPSIWKIISQTTLPDEAWTTTTYAMEIPGHGSVIRTSTQHDGTCAEALVYCPGVFWQDSAGYVSASPVRAAIIEKLLDNAKAEIAANKDNDRTR